MLAPNGESGTRGAVLDPRPGVELLVYLAPSVRYSSGKGWGAYVSMGLPIIENLNGIQSDPKFRVFAGMSIDLGKTN